MSRRTRITVDGVVSLIRRASDPGEPIFTFPVYPIFHWQADRPAETFAILHWFDVTPDSVVSEDLHRILAAPPPVVVLQRVRPDDLIRHEHYFRGGERSALRYMQADIDEMLANRYLLAGCWWPVNRYSRLEVWVRADRVQERGIDVIPTEDTP